MKSRDPVVPHLRCRVRVQSTTDGHVLLAGDRRRHSRWYYYVQVGGNARARSATRPLALPQESFGELEGMSQLDFPRSRDAFVGKWKTSARSNS